MTDPFMVGKTPQSVPDTLSSRMAGGLHLIFFLSGAAVLIYQLVWLRILELVFGVTVYAVGTVLAAFMAGMALGSLIFGQIADRMRRPLLLLVLFETGLMLYALAFPSWLRLIMTLLTDIMPDPATPFFGRNIFRFGLGFCLLLPPAALAGGGLPVVGKTLIRSRSRLGGQVGGLYAACNAGAFLGCVLTGFFLVRMLGARGATLVGAALNGVNLVLLVFWILRKHPAISPQETVAAVPYDGGDHAAGTRRGIPAWIGVILAALVFEGFCAAAYELVWMRMLNHFSADKSLALTGTVFAAFLFGLSAGSLAVRRWIDRTGRPLAVLGVIEMAIGLAGLAVPFVLRHLGGRFMQLRAGYSENWWNTIGAEYAVFFLILAAPATLMGMTFPIFGRLLCDSIPHLGGRLGRLGFLDTAGSILGAFAAGFFLIPAFGLIRTGTATAVISLAVGAALILIQPDLRPKTRTAFLIAFFLAGTGLACVLPVSSAMTGWQGRRPEDRVVFHAEGPSATVTVFETLEGERRMAINGSISAFGESDLEIDKMRGLVPALLHPGPKTALAVGLGMGVAARSLLTPGLTRLDCVELSETVALASDSCYGGVNGRVMRDPRFHLIVEDGRNFLLLTPDTYDVISSNSIHARLSGFLYTREFYALCRSRLNPGGVVCQWLTTNWLTEEEFKRLVAAFLVEFPHTRLWASGVSNLILVGSETPLKVDVARLEFLFRHPEVTPLLTDPLLMDPLDELPRFLSRFVCAEDALRDYVRGTPPETDDRTAAEFSRVVKPACNPAIIGALAAMKTDIGPWLIVEDGADRDGFRRDILASAAAEKACMEGILAFNYLDDRERGAGLLNEAVKRDSLSFRYRDLLSSFYRFDGRPDDAIGTLLPLMSVRPGDIRLLRRLGMLYLENGETDRAVQMLTFPADRGDVLSLYFLGLAWMQAGRPDRALDRMSRVVSHRPEFLDARMQLGLLLTVFGRYGEAAVHLQYCRDRGYGTEEIRRIAAQFPELRIR